MKFNNPSGSSATGSGSPRTGLGSWGKRLCRRGSLGQLVLVSAASLGLAGMLTACSQLTATLTVDFVYVSSAKAAGADNYGEVNVFEINSESGHLRQIPTSPFPSGGRNPVAEAVSSDHANLYVVNQDDNSIVQFAIGNDGKIYPQNTVNTPGVFPLATSVGASSLSVSLSKGAGTTKDSLYVADTYQPLPTCSPAAPCSGSFAVFPILPADTATPAGKLQTATPVNDCNGLQYVPLARPGAANHVLAPTAINATANGSYLFVTAVDTTASPNVGYVFAYAVGVLQCQNTGSFPSVPTLTPLPGSPYAAGSHPSAVITDPGAAYLYVTDSASSDVLAWTVTTGGLTPLGGSPFPTGSQPSSIAIDATGKFAVVANSKDSNASTYSINNGVLSTIGTYATGLQPVALGIDPRMNKYIFTANFLGNNVSGFALSSDGSLINTQNSPFASNANPTAVAAIPHNGSTK